MCGIPTIETIMTAEPFYYLYQRVCPLEGTHGLIVCQLNLRSLAYPIVSVCGTALGTHYSYNWQSFIKVQFPNHSVP